jgi:hypothetical protein
VLHLKKKKKLDCCSIYSYNMIMIPHSFGGTYCLYLQGGSHRYPEDGGNRFFQNTRHHLRDQYHNPEDHLSQFSPVRRPHTLKRIQVTPPYHEFYNVTHVILSRSILGYLCFESMSIQLILHFNVPPVTNIFFFTIRKSKLHLIS